MSKCVICDRAFEFSSRVLKLCDQLSRHGLPSRHIAAELVRCGTSIGANAEEAQDAQSKRDYIAKMSIARKEARETLYWLRLAKSTGLAEQVNVDWEVNEASELRAMIVAAIKTAQSNQQLGTDSIRRLTPQL